MKTILKLSLALLLVAAASGCASTGGSAASNLAPTVSGSVSVGASTHF
jgi:hypothetical protein